MEAPAALSYPATNPYFLRQYPVFPCDNGSWFYQICNMAVQIANGSDQFPNNTEARGWSWRPFDSELFDLNMATNIIAATKIAPPVSGNSIALPPTTSDAPSTLPAAPTTSPDWTQTPLAPTKTAPVPTTSPSTLPTNQDVMEDILPTKPEELVLRLPLALPFLRSHA